jgi:hypothetical protein
VTPFDDPGMRKSPALGHGKRRLAALLALAFFLSACGGQTLGIPTPPGGGGPAGGGGPTAGGVPTANQPAPAGASIDACALLTDAEVTAGTGEAVTSRKHSTLTQVFPSVCDLELSGGGSVFGGNPSLSIKVLATGGKTLYENSFEPFIGQSNSLLTDTVPDLGDKAGRADDDELMVLKGDVLFDVFYLEAGRQNKLDVIRYLAQIILGKLSCIAAGCPDITPPPPLPTPVSSAADTGLTGGHLTPANEKFRVVNLYADAAGPEALDVYGWDQTMHATLLATVEYGQVSDFFDPGIGTNDIGDTGPLLSFVVHGGELLPYAFNLSDVSNDPAPGTMATIAAAPSDLFGDTVQLGTNFLYENRPDGNPIASPLPDTGVLQINTDGLVYTGPASYYYLSVGSGCLSIPDFPTVPRRVGGGLNAEGSHESGDGAASVPAGTWQLTAHPDPGVREGFGCDNPVAAPPAPLTINNGQLAFVFLYRAIDETQLHTLIVPFSAGVTP